MNRFSMTVLALLACLLLAATADPALADCGCGGPAGRPTTPRSNLSGLGVGLAGIGLAWGLTWIGLRLVGRVNRK